MNMWSDSFRSTHAATAQSRRGQLRQALRWWRAPWWFLQLFTGAKSFVDNPLIGSRRLNRAGLHAARIRLAHGLAARRRRRLAGAVPAELRSAFERDGFIRIDDFLPATEFAALRDAVVNSQLPGREHQQGDTVTRRTPIDPELRKQLPNLDGLLRDRRWQGILRYVASTASRPLYYVQTILGGVSNGPPDPQVELHADTFHPSMKAWLFLTDVPPDGRPLVYVPGSHRLTPQRLAWERRKSIDIVHSGDRLSQRGSFRVREDELPGLGLGAPLHFAVPANTLVVVDTCGFHARASSNHPTKRLEIWGYARRSPFLPWAGGDLLSLPPFADRRAAWLLRALDWLDRRGLAQQQWKNVGRKSPLASE